MKIFLFLLLLTGAGWWLYSTYGGGANNVLKPRDSEFPAASACDYQEGDTVLIELNEDIPYPRCAKIMPGQKLRVGNNTERTVSVWFENVSAAVLFPSSADIRPDSQHLFGKPAGDYLAPGVHRLQTSLYGGSGPEIWLIE